MTPEQKAYYLARIEKAKDDTPSTGLFVWFVPVFVALALFCRTEPTPRKAPVFKLQDSAFICVMGVCL